MTFKDLRIVEPILKALEAKGYINPTPIQEQAIPILLQGKDLLGCAQTGTGKTAAFAIPILQHIFLDTKHQNKKQRVIKALVVTPTRELAIQIADNFTEYAQHTGIKNTVIFGGVKQGGQTRILRQGVDILVATPGRLLDLMNQGFISLKHIEYLVLDEADHMLDMGFIHDIRKIIAKVPEKRQSLFFSATMPSSIVTLANKILGNPERVTIKPSQATAERVEQGVYFVAKSNKRKLLVHLLRTQEMPTVLIFSRTKYGADKIVKFLKQSDIKSEAIHGNKSQGARQRALKDFKNGKTTVLVATDIAARGIDVENMSHVINFDLPNIAETYVHRIGRTGRASASGIALSFCDVEERAYLKKIQSLIKQEIPVIKDNPFVDDETVDTTKSSKSKGKGNNSSRKGGNGANKNNKPRRNYSKNRR